MSNRGLETWTVRIVAVANEKSLIKMWLDRWKALYKRQLIGGQNNNILVKIDRETGNISLQKVLDVIWNLASEITPKDANSINKNENLRLVIKYLKNFLR